MSRTALAFILFGLIAVVGVAGMLIQRARAAAARRRERQARIPLVIPVTRGVTPPTPWRPPVTPSHSVAASNGHGSSNGNGSTASYAPPSGVVPAPGFAPSFSGGSQSHMTTPDTPSSRASAALAEEGTLQLLPGRFEVVAGIDGGRDIRFVRGPGGVPEVTLGRIEGPMYRHVQLPAQTVSRMHARMRFEQGRWHIANLSPTNPLVVNGELLEADGAARTLVEGDRVELGEVVLRFRERA